MIRFNDTTALSRLVETCLGFERETDFAKPLAGGSAAEAACTQVLQDKLAADRVYLTPSCTSALEMAALVCQLQAGDEVIVPSNTFVSSALAFVLRGAVPVFVDCCPRTKNIEVAEVEKAITNKTKVIVPVHYAGMACDMERILEIGRAHNILVIEDAAQAVDCRLKGQALGTIGDIGTYSFHETKNFVCGEGGALIVSNPHFLEMAETAREKGTDRSRFFRGEVDKYTWRTLGSSYLLSGLAAAYLLPQFENMQKISQNRVAIWEAYYRDTAALQSEGLISQPYVPNDCQHNGHMFYVLLDHRYDREQVIKAMLDRGVQVASHYVPLHSSPAGRKFGRFVGDMKVTNDISQRLIRLPLYYGLSEQDQAAVMQVLDDVLRVLNT